MRTRPSPGYPLDLERTAYSYVERPNPVIASLLDRYVLSVLHSPRILDVGCGCGANARAVRARSKNAHIVGIEPNERAAKLASEVCDEVFHGDLDGWLGKGVDSEFDAVILSDVVEHIADPIAFLRSLASSRPLSRATWIVSVPNYAVWYNRILTLFGQFDYAWSGLFDRTHLRFFTLNSIRKLLSYCGFEVLAQTCTPSIVQSAAPALRLLFKQDVADGEHLALMDSRLYRLYQTYMEPVETKVCQAWPRLLGFQVVSVARVIGAGHSST